MMSVVIRDKDVQDVQWLQLDECGVINDTPLGNSLYTQLFACDSCLVNGKILLKYAQWNVHGLGQMPMSLWLSEESFISTIVTTIGVKHCGGGGHSFKQESKGPATFYYHNALKSLHMLLKECSNETRVAVGWIQRGHSVRTNALMMIRICVVLQAFLYLWNNNATYKVQCLQHANGEWTAEKVDSELIPLIESWLQKKPATTNEPTSNNHFRAGKHMWPWTVTNDKMKRFYITVGDVVRCSNGMAEQYLFIQANPCMFSNVQHGDIVHWCKEMSLRRFGLHLASLSDNRLCKHDRALFVLNYVLLKKKVVQSTFGELPSFLNACGDLELLAKQLREDLEMEKTETNEERDEKTYVSDSLVYSLISGLKMYSKNIPGHPMARAAYRRELKCLHRSLNPGSVWLTINIGDKGNEWLQRMYGGNDIDYETVKSGGVLQALFFDAYVQSFLDNVIMAEDGLFEKVDWAGGIVEWCQDGTSHIHMIIALDKISPQNMALYMQDKQMLRQVEEWIASRFCENNDHSDMPNECILRVLQENGKLLHVHGAVCYKYQKRQDDGQCTCRFKYARCMCQCDNGAECIVDEESGSWHWRIQRDHSMALCHCDQLYEINHVVGGLPEFHHFCQFFGGSGADGQRVIMYATNYTTKMGMSRVKMKTMLLEVVEQAIGKLKKVGESHWSVTDRVLWIIRTALLKVLQGVSIPQAQAAMNMLELPEYYCRVSGGNVKVVTLFSPPFVDYVYNEGRFSADLSVADYIYRSASLEEYSPWLLAFEEWRKEKKVDGAKEDHMHVSFQVQHAQSQTHWLVHKQRKKKRNGAAQQIIMVNVIRRKQFIIDENMQRIWLLCMSVPWRTPQDVLNWSSWNDYVEENENDDAVKAMQWLLVNELSLAKEKKVEQEKEEHVGDAIEMVQQQKNNNLHLIVQQRDDDDDIDIRVLNQVGGAVGHDAVMSAKLAGLIPSVVNDCRNEEKNDLVVQRKTKRQRIVDDNAVDWPPLPNVIPEVQLFEIVQQWKAESVIWKQCNEEHKLGIMPCIIHLVNAMSGNAVKPFSLVVQGGGGTGKTHCIIGAVSEFMQYVCDVVENDKWNQLLLIVAPTNMVARALGGHTIDSVLVNRRRPQDDPKCSPNVVLVLIDEFSMVSLGWIAQIDEALQELKKKLDVPFGGVSVTWIGDLHQIPPVMGTSVFTPMEQLKKAKERKGRELWTHTDLNMAVLMKQQYRMNGELVQIAENFAMGKQNMNDAQLLCNRVLDENAALSSNEWREKFEELTARVLCCANDAKAALNWELVQWLKHDKYWKEWEAVAHENVVVEQLEPKQCVWKWMPVICLENIKDTKVVNGALCYIVSVEVIHNDDDIPKCVYVVAAENEQEAKELVGNDDLDQLIQDGIVVGVGLMSKDNGFRGIPLVPAWCMTLFKAQGATMDTILLYLSAQRLSAFLFYTAITRVHHLSDLWFLDAIPPSLILGLSFPQSMHDEVKRLKHKVMNTIEYVKWSKLFAEEEKWINRYELIDDDAEDKNGECVPVLSDKHKAVKVVVPVSDIREISMISDTNDASLMVNCCADLLYLWETNNHMDMNHNLDVTKWDKQQQCQINRVQLLSKLHVSGDMLCSRFEYIKRRVKENEWKKVFPKGTRLAQIFSYKRQCSDADEVQRHKKKKKKKENKLVKRKTQTINASTASSTAFQAAINLFARRRKKAKAKKIK